MPGAQQATVLLDTDWERFGGATPDAGGAKVVCAQETVLVDLPACSGKLVRIGSMPRRVQR